MFNPAYILGGEEPPISDEQVEHLDKTFSVPIDEAIALTDDKLNEDVMEGLRP
jgi:hypothetical protein